MKVKSSVNIPPSLVEEFLGNPNMGPYLQHPVGDSSSLEYKIDITNSFSDMTAIQHVRTLGQLKFLVEAGADYKYGGQCSIVHNTIAFQWDDMFCYLLGEGIDIEGYFILSALIRSPDEFFLKLLDGGLEVTFCHVRETILDRNLRHLQLLHDAGVDLTQFKGKDLVPLASGTDIDMLQFLLGIGFDINEENSHGKNSLHVMAWYIRREYTLVRYINSTLGEDQARDTIMREIATSKKSIIDRYIEIYRYLLVMGIEQTTVILEDGKKQIALDILPEIYHDRVCFTAKGAHLL